MRLIGCAPSQAPLCLLEQSISLSEFKSTLAIDLSLFQTNVCFWRRKHHKHGRIPGMTFVAATLHTLHQVFIVTLPVLFLVNQGFAR